MASAQLSWDVQPKNGIEVFFSRESYEKYSMSPNLPELWLLANSKSVENVKSSGNPQEDQQDSGPPVVTNEEEVQPTLSIFPLPEHMISYPYFSSLTAGEQKTYVHMLAKFSSRKHNSLPVGHQKQEYNEYLNLKSMLQNEIAEFLKFMQNVARNCAADYDHITKDALLYAEELLNASMGQVKKYPELYVLQEITSLMGGKVCTDLTFKLEKKVLTLGEARFVRTVFPVMPSLVQIPVDYAAVSKFTPADKKASVDHKDISSDPNAEKLALKYRPQVALTAQSLCTLLNNHGINYKEQWELPVCVKMLQVKDTEAVKMVYIDPPLPKKELNVREKNQMFHEVPFDALMSKKTAIPVSLLFMDLQEKETVAHDDALNENVEPPKRMTPESMELDFDDDVTELETFGVSCKTSKKLKTPSPVKPKIVPAVLLSKLQLEKEILSSGRANPEEHPSKGTLQRPETGASSFHSPSNRVCSVSTYDSLWSDSDDAASFKGFASDEIEEFVESDSDADKNVSLESSSEVPTKINCSTTKVCALDTKKSDNTVMNTSSTSDTDEERLVIDTECKVVGELAHHPGAIQSSPRSPSLTPAPSVNSAGAGLNSEQRKDASKKAVKRLSKDFDPVGQILKMQTKLMKANPRKAPEQPLASLDKNSPVRPKEKPALAPVLSSPPSNAAKATTTAGPLQAEKHLLPVELQILAEDASEYTPPEDNNLVYKLFSLDGMLLLIRCTVQKVKTKTGKQKNSISRHVPTFILPKIEYQASYGVEALTKSEICRLWTESLLHSHCCFYVGHIDTFSSALFMLEEITAEGIKDKFGTFMPSNSLNILRHILQKVTSLQEGSYLLSHAAGDSSVSIYRSTDGNVCRTAYNLHKAHSSMPQAPSTLSVPWVPLDPTVLLPYHVSQGRVPCTFPPRPDDITERKRVGAPGNQREMPNPGKTVSMEAKCSSNLPAQPAGNKGVGKKKNKGKWSTFSPKWQNKHNQS